MHFALGWLIFIVAAIVGASATAQRAYQRISGLIARLGRSGAASVSLVFGVSLAAAATPMFLGFRPVPSIHDEFAYLLSADTFLHGRVTNPPHPMAAYLEAFHVIHEPTYSSKFPPAQGLALAAGRLLGHPLFGAWLTVAAACAATAWMLRAMLPGGWALVGGLAAALHSAVHWWSQSYWGGGVAMLGGALVGGGAFRAMKRPSISSGVAIGFGAAVLANSRPFEGFVVTVTVGLFLLGHALRYRCLAALLLRTGVPAAITLAPFVAMMGYYNWRITGSALTMPYTLHQRQYMIAPLMFFQKPNPMPDYRHDIIRRFHEEDELPVYLKQTTLAGWAQMAAEISWNIARGLIRPWPMVLAVAASLVLFRRRGIRLALLVCLILPAAHMALSPWMRLQYMAPAAPLLFGLIAAGLMRIAQMRLGRVEVGRAVVCGLVVAYLSGLIFDAARYARRVPPPPGLEREAFVQWLLEQPGDHLVIVRNSPTHPPTADWVFNGADIDGSRIVFARQIDPDGDRPLLEYFANRHKWVLDLDGPIVRYRPLYP